MTAGCSSLSKVYKKRYGPPLALLVTSVLLGFGLCLPLLRIEKMLFWENEYSVATGVFGLAEDGQILLAAVVFFWSVAFPIAKLGMLFWIWYRPMNASQRERMLVRLERLGRWSMLDVFIVAVLIVAAKLGPLADVTAEPGLFVFGAAVVLSMLVASRIARLSEEAGAR